jgi:magnesium-transporting ATPase (P-type)
MERPPRPPGQPILSKGLVIWLVSVGLVIAAGTLSVISWAEQEHTLTIARTMGVVTFSLLNLFFSIEAKDERQSAFSLDTFSDRTFIVTTGLSFFLLVMSTVLRPFQTILKTTTLDVRQCSSAHPWHCRSSWPPRSGRRCGGGPPLKSLPPTNRCPGQQQPPPDCPPEVPMPYAAR